MDPQTQSWQSFLQTPHQSAHATNNLEFPDGAWAAIMDAVKTSTSTVHKRQAAIVGLEKLRSHERNGTVPNSLRVRNKVIVNTQHEDLANAANANIAAGRLAAEQAALSAICTLKEEEINIFANNLSDDQARLTRCLQRMHYSNGISELHVAAGIDIYRRRLIRLIRNLTTKAEFRSMRTERDTPRHTSADTTEDNALARRLASIEQELQALKMTNRKLTQKLNSRHFLDRSAPTPDRGKFKGTAGKNGAKRKNAEKPKKKPPPTAAASNTSHPTRKRGSGDSGTSHRTRRPRSD